MSSERELPGLLKELAELIDQRGGPAQRNGWPSRLRTVAERLRANQAVDLAEFHRQLVGGAGSLAQSDGEGVWDLVERIVTALPAQYPDRMRSSAGSLGQ